MYTVAELVLLARAYMVATGLASSSLGKLAAGNDRLFIRLFEGFDCRAETAERASAWFNLHAGEWWPKEVRRRYLDDPDQPIWHVSMSKQSVC